LDNLLDRANFIQFLSPGQSVAETPARDGDMACEFAQWPVSWADTAAPAGVAGFATAPRERLGTVS